MRETFEFIPGRPSLADRVTAAITIALLAFAALDKLACWQLFGATDSDILPVVAVMAGAVMLWLLQSTTRPPVDRQD